MNIDKALQEADYLIGDMEKDSLSAYRSRDATEARSWAFHATESMQQIAKLLQPYEDMQAEYMRQAAHVLARAWRNAADKATNKI